jgi:hypothetical protein
MWELRCFTNLWASTACYEDRFTFAFERIGWFFHLHCQSISPQGRSRSYFTTDGRSVSQSVSQYVLVLSTLVGLATRCYFLSECCCLKFVVLFLWSALSDEKTGLSVSSTLVGLATRCYFLSECCCLKFVVLFLWGALSDERTSLLISNTLVGLATRYYFLSESCCLKFADLFLRDALSDERTSLQFAVSSFNGASRAEPVTILYCLIWDSRNLEGQVPVFISPRNKVTQLYPHYQHSVKGALHSHDLMYTSFILHVPCVRCQHTLTNNFSYNISGLQCHIRQWHAVYGWGAMLQGRRFESRGNNLICSIDLIFPAALWSSDLLSL